MNRKERTIKEQVEFHIKEKRCLNCGNELTYKGQEKDSYGWCQHYQCDSCGALHEFSPNDMGQGNDYLSMVTDWIDHVPTKPKK